MSGATGTGADSSLVCALPRFFPGFTVGGFPTPPFGGATTRIPPFSARAALSAGDSTGNGVAGPITGGVTVEGLWVAGVVAGRAGSGVTVAGEGSGLVAGEPTTFAIGWVLAPFALPVVL